MDNGANTIKIGYAQPPPPKDSAVGTPPGISIIPNCIAKSKSERRRPFIASQISDCRDSSGLFLILPHQRGYVCRPDTQRVIWDFVLGPECQNISPPETNLIITEPILNFNSIQETMCEILFEDYEFNGVCRTTAPHMVDYYYGRVGPGLNSACTIIVDSGHSFTHVVPFVNGQKVTNCVRRIDVGGKALTNHLKEIVSYRQLHVLDEFYLMNQVKEDICYVSTDFTSDMELARKRHPENSILREYVLPNYVTVHRGFVRKQEEFGHRATNDDQILRLNAERFSVPELIFNPSDVGLKQMGLSETIISVISDFPESMQPHFYKNICLSGGNARFPGFRDRVQADMRSGTSYYYDVNVTVDLEPERLAWQGGCAFANDPDFSKYLVTRTQYDEVGFSAFDEKSDI